MSMTLTEKLYGSLLVFTFGSGLVGLIGMANINNMENKPEIRDESKVKNYAIMRKYGFTCSVIGLTGMAAIGNKQRFSKNSGYIELDRFI